MTNTLRKILTAGALGLALAGCAPKIVREYNTVNGYDVTLIVSDSHNSHLGLGRADSLYPLSGFKNGSAVRAEFYDGVLNEIGIDVKNDTALENLANPRDLTRILKQVKARHPEIK